jgi:hypothetical protein
MVAQEEFPELGIEKFPHILTNLISDRLMQNIRRIGEQRFFRLVRTLCSPPMVTRRVDGDDTKIV